MREPQPESYELDDEGDPTGIHNRARFIAMGFEPLEAMMLVHAGAHPTEVEKLLKQRCPLHVALRIYL